MAVEAEDLAARLKAEFPHALRSGQVVAYYQPEVELSSGRVVAAESLARWEHPDFGTLPPALFTPVAGQLGLMGELTRMMLRLSLTQHRVWAAAGWVVPISVNVGPDCVTDPGFPAVVAEFLLSEQVPGPMLALEVSEQTGTAAARLTGPPARVTGSDGNPVTFSVSVGIAKCGSCRDLPTLLARADRAIYEAKRAGGGCWRLFEDTEQAADPALA